eukprot:4825575-Amphidinium_carterae.1
MERRLAEHRAECERTARANRRDNDDHLIQADDPPPALPDVENYDPWTPEESKRRKEHKEA